MAVRVVAAALLSAVLMFAWGFVFWVLLGGTNRLSEPLPGELDVLAVLRRENTPSGMYVYPAPPDNMNDELARAEAEKKMAAGPLLRLAFRREGKAGFMEPLDFAKAGAHYAVIGLLLATLTAIAAPALPSFGARVGFVLLAAALAAIWTNLGDVVWWHHSPTWAMGNMAYELMAGFLAGLVIAAIVKPRNPVGKI